MRLDYCSFCTEDHNDATDNYVYWIACGKLIHRTLLEQFPLKKDEYMKIMQLFSNGFMVPAV